MKFMAVDRALAQKHYAIHEGKPFYAGLVDYIVSGPVVVMAFEGTNAVEAARGTIGATNPSKAGAGTIRGDLGLEIGRNLVHGSDSPENGLGEIALWFKPEELIKWKSNEDPWLYE